MRGLRDMNLRAAGGGGGRRSQVGKSNVAVNKDGLYTNVTLRDGA